MASFKRHRSCASALLAGFFVLGCSVMIADAQQRPSGLAVERLYQSAPGGGWFVMDDLDMTGRLGGAVSITSGYARNPLVITGPDGTQKLAVVSQEAFVDIGGSITHDRFRGYLDIPMPLWLLERAGHSVCTSSPLHQSPSEPPPILFPTAESASTLACWVSLEARFVWARERNSSFPLETAPIT
jgi:hypothetical protein